MARSYKQLEERAIATNKNLARIGVIEKFKISRFGIPVVYTIHNANNNLACSGNLSECITFLNGINWIVSNNLYKPVGVSRMPCNNGFIQIEKKADDSIDAVKYRHISDE